MPSMDYRKLLAAGLFLSSGQAFATGIPVYCFNCQEGSSNAAHAILDGIRSQTEALLNGADYVMRTNATLNMIGLQATQKIQNSKDLEPSMGAKPRPACGQAAAASVRGAVASAGAKTRAKLEVAAGNYNMQTRGLAPNEPRRDYSIGKVLDRMDKDEFHAAQLVMEDVPLDPNSAGYADTFKDTMMVFNPFPVEMPSDADIERIKKNGSPAEKEKMANAIALAKRQEVSQYQAVKSFEANTQRFDPAGFQYMLDDVVPYLSSEDQAKLKGKISPNQLDELMATYRVRSSKWVKFVSSTPSQAAVAKEQTLLQAEILNQLFELKQVSKDMVKMLSFSESRNASQAGLQSR